MYSAVACHFNFGVFKFDFTLNCCNLLETKNFSRNPGQFKWVTRETRHEAFIAELLKWILMSQVAELFRRPTIMTIDYETF